MIRNRKKQNKAKIHDGVDLHLGSLKTEATEQLASLDAADENIEFLSHEDSETQKILKLTSDEITYLLDDDGNYYFHTSDADEDIEEIQQEVLQIKSEKAETNEDTKFQTSSVLEKVKLNLSKTPRNIKPKPSGSTEAESSAIVKTDSSQTETENCTKEEEIIEELELNDDTYDFEEKKEGEAKPVSTPIRKSSMRLKAMTDIELTQTKFQCGELRCHICDYKTTKNFTLSRHMKSHTNEKPFKCFVCDRGFKTKASILNHVNTHLGKKPYACKECPSSFTTTGELVRHTRYKHTGEKPHKCTECDYASVELSKLRRHIRCHTGERPYQCPHCTYASPDTFKLKRHLRTHTGEKPYECDICQARFTQSNSLKTHRLIHSVSDKPVFQCEFCPTTCGRKTDLRMHVLKIHNSDKPMTCKRCGKELPDRYAYKLHIKTHQGEKCYRCKLCPYAASLMRHLETHMLIHTDEKPFECEICQQRFRQRQLLRRHVNLYHNKDYVPPVPRAKEHGCPHCKRSFVHKGNLMRHMEIHDPQSNARNQKYELKLGRMTRMQDVVQGSSNADSMDGNEEEEDDEEAYDDPAYHENYDEMDDENYELIDANDEELDEEGQNGIGSYQEHDLDSAVNGGDGVLIENYVDIKPSIVNIPKKMSSKLNATAANDYESRLKTINIKKESDGNEYISVAGDDGQEYMILEVTQSDDEGEADDVELAQIDNDYNIIETVPQNEQYQAKPEKKVKHLVTINKVEHIPYQL